MHSLVIDNFHQHCIRQIMIFVSVVVIPSEYITLFNASITLYTSCIWCVICRLFVGYGDVVLIHGVSNTNHNIISTYHFNNTESVLHISLFFVGNTFSFRTYSYVSQLAIVHMTHFHMH